MPCRSIWFFRIGTLTGTPVLVLAVLELVFRILGLPSNVPIPRESTENAGLVDSSRNAAGLRERWDQVPGDENAVRIGFLGDSFTFAAGVEQEQGFVHKIETLLNRPGELRYVTINMGEPGTDPFEQTQVYRRVKEFARPDVLIHVLYCNDLGHDLYEELKRIHALQNRRSLLARHSNVWRFLERRVRCEMVLKRTVDYFRGGDSPFQRRQAWERLTSGLRAVKEIADADQTPYALVLFPWLFRLDDYPLDQVHSEVRRVADEMEIPFLDLLKTFRGRSARRMRISVIDEHPSPEAHTLAAQRIVRFLHEQGFVQTVPGRSRRGAPPHLGVED